ncbi:curved DNA-binding protein [Nocardiopsis sp. Huas11]|uniref:DnaJ C-terminal domain-containing protein n=1 Tax=Nocardiopsis sp. Huas11 TaxID=2183912 RepID=UPI000EADE6B6|nr:DnaJ C-terminal domain-containing protein [Nocardiopsis sp. Huas11]RKS04743.1 curved DNA-binding protein [Nocardiopsis sp. Huas11]
MFEKGGKMKDQDDPHAVLGLSPDATRQEVDRAFRALARRHHPDAPGGDRASYARVRHAYETLAASRARSAPTGSDAPPPRQGVRIPVRVRRARPRRGADRTAVLRVGLPVAVYGGTADLDSGDGGTVTVAVPPGTGHRTRLRLPGRGGAGTHGGAPGDLLVTVLVEDHPVYRRTGDDLRATLPLGYAEAVLGTEAVITTLDGRELRVPVPPGTAQGATITLPGQGVPGRGDAGALVLDVAIDVPAGPLSAAQRAALEHLGAALPAPRKEPRR